MNEPTVSKKLMLISLLLVAIYAAQRLDGATAAGVSSTGGKEQQAVRQNVALGSQARPTLTPGPTEGPPRPTLTPRPSASGSAEVCLGLVAEPGHAVRPSEILNYQIVAHNNGPGDAGNVRITFPFAPDIQAVVDAAFTSPNAWVSTVFTNAVEMRLGQLRRDETITVTLRLRVNSTVQLGTSLISRAHIGAKDSVRNSNRISLVVGQTTSNPSVSLNIAPAVGMPATTFVVTYDGFASNERVDLWYHRPDGRVVALGNMRADAQGQINFTLPPANLDRGRYTLVAYGQCSQVSVVGMFTVESMQPTPSAAP
jgi:hypothetical protein